MINLQIGHKIYTESYNKVVAVYTVERVTKTLAICENDRKFKRQMTDDGYCFKTGTTDKWNTYSYWLETQQLKDKYFIQKAVAVIKSYDFSKLPTEKIKSIIDIINSK